MQGLTVKKQGWIRTSAVFYMLLLSFGCWGAIDVYEFDDELKRAQFNQLISELRCPKCQNQNLADSNAGLAKDLKDRAYQLIKEGKSNEEIERYLVERYGDFISYRPPLRGGTLLLWFGPLLLFVCVLLIFIVRGRASSRLVVASKLDRQRLDEILNEDK